jgi:hypothetical protein
MITLPDPPSRALVRGTWLALSLGAGLVVAAVSLAAGLSMWPLWGAGVLAMLLVAGRAWPRLGRSAYGAWRRACGGLGRRAGLILERTAFGIVAVVGWAGGDMLRRPTPAASGWRARSTLEAAAYPSSGPAGTPDSRAGWLRSLLAWGRRSGHGWVWALVPVLALQRLIRPSARGGLDGRNYTLY